MSNIYSLSVVILPVFSRACLKDITHGDLITGSTFRTIKNSRLYSCAAECTAYAICKSFNFDKRRLTCNLNFEDGVSYPQAMDDNVDFSYSNITSWKEIPLGPCQNELCGPSQHCNVRRNKRRYCDQFNNVARGKSAAASSINSNKPDVAVDGILATNWYSLSCFAVASSDVNPWWQVDLGDVYLVVETRITNRGDCCPDRLHDFAVEVYNEDPISHLDVHLQLCYMYNGAVTQPGVTVNIPCTTPVTGRYLRLKAKNKLNEEDLFQFCEVQVFGLTHP